MGTATRPKPKTRDPAASIGGVLVGKQFGTGGMGFGIASDPRPQVRHRFLVGLRAICLEPNSVRRFQCHERSVYCYARCILAPDSPDSFPGRAVPKL